MAAENHQRDLIKQDIIWATFEVYRVLGHEFLEKAHQQSVFICVDLWLYLFWAFKNQDVPRRAEPA
jgi:hypothetical protein